MMINQVGMTMMGLMLSFATYNNNLLTLISSLFSIGFYLYLLYTMCWDIGAKDKIRVDSKRMAPMKLKGLWMSLIANIPNLILAVCVIIGRLSISDAVTNSGNFWFVTKMIATCIQGMYAGLLELYAPYNPIAYILIILPALAASELGYYLGYREHRIFGFAAKKPAGGAKKN